MCNMSEPTDPSHQLNPDSLEGEFVVTGETDGGRVPATLDNADILPTSTPFYQNRGTAAARLATMYGVRGVGTYWTENDPKVTDDDARQILGVPVTRQLGTVGTHESRGHRP